MAQATKKPAFLEGLRCNILNQDGEEDIKFGDDIVVQLVSAEGSLLPDSPFQLIVQITANNSNALAATNPFISKKYLAKTVIDSVQETISVKQDKTTENQLLKIITTLALFSSGASGSATGTSATNSFIIDVREIDYQSLDSLPITPLPTDVAQKIQLVRPPIADKTPDIVLWDIIKGRKIKFNHYNDFIDDILCHSQGKLSSNKIEKTIRSQPNRLPFVGVEEYSIIKFATEAYMTTILDIEDSGFENVVNSNSYFAGVGSNKILPYFQLIQDKLRDIRAEINQGDGCSNRLMESLRNFANVELIWNYWMEQGMLVQTMNAITLRFQNIRTSELDPLNRLDIERIRPMGNIIWGQIQDEQHTLSLKRRAYEYDHTYGLLLEGKAVPQMRTVDSRSKFLESFHNLLYSCSIFFKEADDTTRVPDGFSILNNLREVHLLLAEGNHNAYGNLTWTARQEMLVQQYILARSEMREFLGGKIMVPYSEPWMDRVDTMRQMQGWGSTSISYYADLANYGELILLSIRLGNWSQEEDRNSAANWAGIFRNDIQRYIHSYRTVTGVDLSADTTNSRESFAVQPSVMINRRIPNNRQQINRNGTYQRTSSPY